MFASRLRCCAEDKLRLVLPPAIKAAATGKSITEPADKSGINLEKDDPRGLAPKTKSVVLSPQPLTTRTRPPVQPSKVAPPLRRLLSARNPPKDSHRCAVSAKPGRHCDSKRLSNRRLFAPARTISETEGAPKETEGTGTGGRRRQALRRARPTRSIPNLWVGSW